MLLDDASPDSAEGVGPLLLQALMSTKEIINQFGQPRLKTISSFSLTSMRLSLPTVFQRCQISRWDMHCVNDHHRWPHVSQAVFYKLAQMYGLFAPKTKRRTIKDGETPGLWMVDG